MTDGDAGLLLPRLEERLGADDRALVGERVEGVDDRPRTPRLEVEVADRRGGHPVGGGEPVEEPAAGGVEGHLVAQVSEDLGVDPLDLEAGLVLDPALGPEGRRPLVADRRVEQQAGLGQERLGAGQDLGQADAARPEDDRVAPLDDPDVGLPAVLGDPAMLADREPVGMDRPAEDLERQVGDPRPSLS